MPVLRYSFSVLIVLLLAFNPSVRAQDMENPITAIILVDTVSNEQVSVQAVCQNKGEEPRSLIYEITILKRDSRGNVSNNKQGGEFSIDPNGEEVLSTQKMNFDPNGLLTARLKIFSGSKMVADAFYTNGNVEQTPPKKEENPDQGQNEVDPLLDGGLIIDETRTRMGREFYDQFFNNWQTQAPPGIGDYFIRIEEVPFRGLNTEIKVFLDDNTVFKQILQPRSNYVEELVDYVVARMRRAVTQLAELRKDFSEEGDQSGTGIY
ncbi:MAG: hypothetical protein DHS20C18_47750 [Saprospiraceae bacterium]|nr:MAG: hypothetical protein DHS20C18_47750 [Saprospiraceae bacterium]